VSSTGQAGQLGMNSARGLTPPNPTPVLPNRSTDLRKTLGIVGTPHGQSIAKIWSIKTRQIERNRKNPTNTPLTLEPRKPQNRAPLLTDLGGESKGKEPRRVQAYNPTKSQRERPRNRHKKFTKKGLQKSPKRRNVKDTSKP
jgi:hypothetical protein